MTVQPRPRAGEHQRPRPTPIMGQLLRAIVDAAIRKVGTRPAAATYGVK